VDRGELTAWATLEDRPRSYVLGHGKRRGVDFGDLEMEVKGDPRAAQHGFRVRDRPRRKLNLCLPAAMIDYSDDLAVALRQAASPTWPA
jgi:hypothetical protein